jgi:LCP family protein required for cell wall assembly
MPISSSSDGRVLGRASVPGSVGSSPVSAGRVPVDASGRARGSVAVSGGVPAGPVGPRGPVRTGTPYRGRRRPRWGRIFLVIGLAFTLLAAVLAAFGYGYYRSVDAGLNRDDPFAQITGGRPAKVVDGALNILLLGSDSRDPDNKGKPGEWRTDTIIVMHIPASHDKAELISVPRDLYVHVPKSQANPQYGNTNAKINASFSWGGTPLTVQTVEDYTKVRMDHVVLIDFAGFKQVIDALGGIDMNVEQDVKSIHKPYRQFKKGMNHFNGDEALDYARQRYQFADGDFARMRHQQQMMRAIMDKAVSSGTITNPVKLDAFLKATTKALTVDKGFSLVDMAVQFHGIRGENLTFLTSPHLGSQTIGGESVVVPDKAKATALYDAVRTDKVDDWVAQNNASPAPSSSGSVKPKK